MDRKLARSGRVSFVHGLASTSSHNASFQRAVMTSRVLSVSEAIKIASNSVSLPVGYGSKWEIYGPYYASLRGMNGQSATAYSRDYKSALAKRKAWISYIALVLLGYDHLDADRHVSTSNKRAARDIVSSGIKVCHIASVRKPGHQPGIVLADRPADGKVIW